MTVRSFLSDASAKSRTLISLFLFFSALCGCGAPDLSRQGEPSPLAHVRSWAMQTQAIDVNEIHDADFDLVVVDYSRDGSDQGAFTAEEVRRMKGTRRSQKFVLAYLSVGEAEEYRDYFASIISLTDEENPRWPGNRKVRYWMPDWQRALTAYLDRILDAGYDGVFLDVIDAYEYYADQGLNREAAASAMANLVKNLSDHARARRPGFMIVALNGTGILGDSSKAREYLAALDALAIEDVFFYGERESDNPLNLQYEVLDEVRAFQLAGKPVLSLEYVNHRLAIETYYALCAQRGFVPYAGSRLLDKLIRQPTN